MKRKALLLMCVTVATSMLAAKESLTLDKPEIFLVTGGIKLSCVNDEFTATGIGTLYGKKYLPIDTAKRYRLSGEFKAVKANTADNYIRFGIVPSTERSQDRRAHV